MTLVRVSKRRDGKGIKVAAWLPIDSFNRGLVNDAIDPLINCTIPIIAESNKAVPVVVGTALLLKRRDERFLATAHHVLSDSGERPLFYFSAKLSAEGVNGRFLIDQQADLAIMRLSSLQADTLRHRRFVSMDDFDPNADSPQRCYAAVLGYPASQADLINNVTIDPRICCICGFGTVSAAQIEVAFDKKLGAHGADGHVTPPHPTGMSGGPIFGFRAGGRTPVLIGVATRWLRSRKVIQGPNANRLARMIEAF